MTCDLFHMVILCGDGGSSPYSRNILESIKTEDDRKYEKVVL